MGPYLHDAILNPSPLGISIAEAILSEVTVDLVALLEEMGEPLTMQHEQKTSPAAKDVMSIPLGRGAAGLADGVLEKVNPSHRLGACLRAIGHDKNAQFAIMRSIYLLSISDLMPWCTAHRKIVGGTRPQGAPPGWVSYTHPFRDADLHLA